MDDTNNQGEQTPPDAALDTAAPKDDRTEEQIVRDLLRYAVPSTAHANAFRLIAREAAARRAGHAQAAEDFRRGDHDDQAEVKIGEAALALAAGIRDAEGLSSVLALDEENPAEPEPEAADDE